MTVSDGQAMFVATTGNVRSSSKQCSEAAACLVTDMASFDIVAAWCDNLPRDKQGLPPCHSCVMHDACSSYTGQLTQSGLDSWVDRVGSEFERLVECAESKLEGMMSKYNRGNDVAADEYADKISRDQAYDESVDAIASRKMSDREWLATNIDSLMACSDCVDGVTEFAFDIADVFTTGRGRDSFFDRLQDQLKARAYDQAEGEING